MKVRAIFSEAFRNVSSGASRPAVMTFALVALCGIIGIGDAMSIMGIIRDGNQFKEAGGATYIILAESGIDAAQCEALGRSRGAIGSGALRTVPGGQVVSLPISGISLREGTPGLLRAMAPATGLSTSSSRDNVLVSEALASSLGSGIGSTISTSSGPLRLTDTFRYPNDGRDPVLDNTILGIVPAVGIFDQCWLDVWRADPSTPLSYGPP